MTTELFWYSHSLRCAETFRCLKVLPSESAVDALELVLRRRVCICVDWVSGIYGVSVLPKPKVDSFSVDWPARRRESMADDSGSGRVLTSPQSLREAPSCPLMPPLSSLWAQRCSEGLRRPAEWCRAALGPGRSASSGQRNWILNLRVSLVPCRGERAVQLREVVSGAWRLLGRC